MIRSFVFLLLLAPCLLLAQQPPALSGPASPPPAAAPTAPPVQPPSAILRPALDQLQQALPTIQLKRWKAPGDVLRQTDANLSSIRNDLDSTLPALLQTADQNPGSAADLIPVFRNVSALYDVLLRISQIGLLAAPGSQSVLLQNSLESLERGRRVLGDNLQTLARSESRQIHTLAAQVHTLQTAPPPPAPVCPPPPVPEKPHRRHHHRTTPKHPVKKTAPASEPPKPS